MDSARPILDDLLRDCRRPTTAAIAAIDFSGRDLRGTIGLRTTRSVLLETYRAAVGAVPRMDSAAATGWTCELANQWVDGRTS